MVAVVALAVAGAFLGLRLARPAVVDTALGSISVRVTPAWNGSVDAFIPLANWGVRADAFDAPFELHVEARRVDRQALLAAAGGDLQVLERAEADARDAAGRVLAQAVLWTLGGALAVGLIAALAAAAFRGLSLTRTLALTAGPPLAMLVLVVAVVERAQDSFDPSAFERPSFYARGEELAQLIEVAGSARSAEDRYRNSVQQTLAGYAQLLAAGGGLGRVETDPPAVLASDLHGNVVVLDPLRELFSEGPAFFVGDFGQRGTEAEADLIVPRLAGLGEPLVAVSGNHDSRLLMRRLARVAVVLTERGRLRPDGTTDGRPVTRIAGLRVAGYADPLEWRRRDPDDPSRRFSFAERPDGDRELARASERLHRWYSRLRPRPDVVLIHQNGLAQSLARHVQDEDPDGELVILTGHDHRQHVDLYDGVVVVDAGTTGAGGLFGVATTAVGTASLHFAGGRLEAIDLVRVEPISGAAAAERVIPSSPAACEAEQVRCHGERQESSG